MKLNPIEMAWGLWKAKVAKRNTTYVASEVLELTKEAKSEVTPAIWQKLVAYVKREEEKYWEV